MLEEILENGLTIFIANSALKNVFARKAIKMSLHELALRVS